MKRSRLAATGALLALVLFAALLLRGAFALLDRQSSHRKIVVIGSKSFTEGILLGELLAQQLERAGLGVERRFNLGGTQICFEAVRTGAIDLYAEYTGTGLQAILHQPTTSDPAAALRTVREVFAHRYDLVWLLPLGFSNTYALAMPQRKAAALGIRRISDLRAHPELTAGFASEFLARADGWPGLEHLYGLRFAGGPRGMEAGLMYQAAASGQLDVISAYSTDGRIMKADLVILEDDRHFFPPYEAVPLVRRDALSRLPQLRPLLESLGGRVAEPAMRQMNLAVDGAHRPPGQVVREFLARPDRGR